MFTKEDSEKFHNVAIEKLQIIIVTYNRAKYLERTLNCLLDKDSPVREIDILVQDNCSSDNTKQICENFKQKYQNFSYITNRYNVGVGVNLAKAYENFYKDYLWLLGDDDLYDWSNWHEVENAIFRGEKVIFVSHTTLPECHKDSIPWLLSLAGFLPATILSKDLITSTVVKNCYEKAVSLYPQLVPLIPFINKGGSFYVCKKEIVKWGGFEQNKSDERIFSFGDNLGVLSKRSLFMRPLNGFIDTLADLCDQQLKYAITRFQLESTYIWWKKKSDGREKLDVIIDQAIKNHYFYNLLDIYQSADPKYQNYIIDKLFERKSELLNKEKIDKSSRHLVEKDPFSEFSESQIDLYKFKANVLRYFIEQYSPCANSNVVIWGTGKYGQYIYQTLTYLIPSIRVEAFIDSFAKEDSDRQLFNKPIISPRTAYEQNKNDWFIVASEAYKQIILSIPKSLKLKVIDSSYRKFELFQVDFESLELLNIIGLSWADYSNALQHQNKIDNKILKNSLSIFEDEQSRLCYEKLCSIMYESNFDHLTYFSTFRPNPNTLVKGNFVQIKIESNPFSKDQTENISQPISEIRNKDDVITDIRKIRENIGPLFITVDVSLSKKDILEQISSLNSKIVIDVIINSVCDLIELPTLYKEYLSNMKVYMTKNNDNQMMMCFR